MLIVLVFVLGTWRKMKLGNQVSKGTSRGPPEELPLGFDAYNIGSTNLDESNNISVDAKVVRS
jgi:hypothetical protein